MNGRTTVLILFFWAVLTIVTPVLVRMSASAKPTFHFNGEETEGSKAGKGLLSRRALVAVAPPPPPPPPPPLPLAPAPEPSPKIEPRLAINKIVER
ncbi:hypothetical protein RHSIM_Rhsim06G0030900 [Rhododendron simsii]|uniref:Uncharacterized protein n=1 Tax=Rhododendron simsii TaxID=118357 RepID=A0A834H4U9_RHOSS|nr:hypothetical protein RHSIM_Rhsim06G0030900 [Rhododendron simsii]